MTTRELARQELIVIRAAADELELQLRVAKTQLAFACVRLGDIAQEAGVGVFLRDDVADGLIRAAWDDCDSRLTAAADASALYHEKLRAAADLEHDLNDAALWED